MTSATCQACGRDLLAPAFASTSAHTPPSSRSSLSEAGDSNDGKDNVANITASNAVVTINAADWQAI